MSKQVWPSRKALVRLVSTRGPRFESASALLSFQKLWPVVDTVLSLCSSKSMKHLNAGVILVVTV